MMEFRKVDDLAIRINPIFPSPRLASPGGDIERSPCFIQSISDHSSDFASHFIAAAVMGRIIVIGFGNATKSAPEFGRHVHHIQSVVFQQIQRQKVIIRETTSQLIQLRNQNQRQDLPTPLARQSQEMLEVSQQRFLPRKAFGHG